MVRALVAFVIVVGGCTTEALEDSPPQGEGVAQQPAQIVQQPAVQTPDRVAQISACQKLCWEDIPVNGCKAQRDRCFKRAVKRDKAMAQKATTDDVSADLSAGEVPADKLVLDKMHCREMGRECRQIRHDCLTACEK
jgi:hypothetical protein